MKGRPCRWWTLKQNPAGSRRGMHGASHLPNSTQHRRAAASHRSKASHAPSPGRRAPRRCAAAAAPRHGQAPVRLPRQTGTPAPSKHRGAAAAAAPGSAAGGLTCARHAHRSPAAATTVRPSHRCTEPMFLPMPVPSQLEDPGEVDMVVCCRGELRRVVEHEVHRVQRLEHRIQKRAAALPSNLRRLLAGAIAVRGWGE